MSEIDRYKLQPALAHAAEAACSYYLTNGFCGLRNCQQCKCWDRARAVMDATGLSARAVGFIFKHRNRIEEAAEQEETHIYQGVPWWSKPERIAAENKLASNERPEGTSNPSSPDEIRREALEESAKVADAVADGDAVQAGAVAVARAIAQSIRSLLRKGEEAA